MEKEFKFKNLLLYFILEVEASNEKKAQIDQACTWLAEVFYHFIQNKIKSNKTISLSLVDNGTIQEINREHRNKDKITDVLSFPMQDSIRHDEWDTFAPEVEIGDILICDSVCDSQAVEFKLDYIDEFIHLAIHGFLHVCGYDHEISLEEEKVMESLEEKLIKQVSELKKHTNS